VLCYWTVKGGNYGSQFLGISAGAQALAMGSAGVAQITDASSIYWNPGAFVQVDRSEFQFVNTPWLAGTQYRWFGIMLNIDHEMLLELV